MCEPTLSSKRRRGQPMKYWIAGLTALLASCIVTPSAHACGPPVSSAFPEVCGYTVTGVFGVNCPVRNGQTACLSVSTAIGPCDATIQCFGGPGFFCRATLIPKSGPQTQCPFSSVRPKGFNCFAPRLFVPTRTPTPPPVETDTATFTATDTPPVETATATDTPAEATATATDTPPVFTPTDTATGTPTGT